ncbi:MAG: hypothetical protein AAFY71_25060 [Bacteroidota bacterium]
MNFLYPTLAPQDRFINILEHHLLPQLKDENFKLLKTGPSLKATAQDGFEWIVQFDGRKFNVENHICRFNPYFLVRNSRYRRFLKKHPALTQNLGNTGQVGNTASIRHWDKTLFSATGTPAYFLEDNDFAKHDNLNLVDEMAKNIKTVGIPYFKMMSDFDSLRKFYEKTNGYGYAPVLIDLCYVLGKEEQVSSIFEWYDTDEDKSDWLNQKIDLRRKMWQDNK